MGLTNRSTGAHAADGMLAVVKRRETDSVVALAGNPNVGKSTVFNELTGMNQHTGNWPGKTVASAQGYCETGGWGCVLVDIPGCYSLMAHSAEEAVARDFICFGGANAVVVVCDASCLERNLNLALQAMEITDNVVLCVNLMDEARRKGVEVDAALLGELKMLKNPWVQIKEISGNLNTESWGREAAREMLEELKEAKARTEVNR